MAKKKVPWLALCCWGIVLIASAPALGADETPMDYLTWESAGESVPAYPLPPMDAGWPPLEVKPWAGTISHHLLTAPLIAAWFQELASRRQVKTFYILSPSHGDRNGQPWALARGRWKVRDGWVEVDEPKAGKLAHRLGIGWEPEPFQYEHGVSVFMPYIKRWFPDARVVALAYRGEPPVSTPLAERLFSAVSPDFDAQGRAENFLLVSTDFAHHGTVLQTQEKDARSSLFWAKPGMGSWILVGCDNRPGIYVLARFGIKASGRAILWHTDSWQLVHKDEKDITSYFFTWIW